MKPKNTSSDNQRSAKRPVIRELSPQDLDKLSGGTEIPRYPFGGWWGVYRKYRL